MDTPERRNALHAIHARTRQHRLLSACPPVWWYARWRGRPGPSPQQSPLRAPRVTGAVFTTLLLGVEKTAAWEGDTLVVETTNFKGGQSRGTGPNMHLVERFWRIDPDTVGYEFTVTDPTVYTQSYTAMMPLRRTDGPLYEYACHEGNIGMHGILAGARIQEMRGIPLRP